MISVLILTTIVLLILTITVINYVMIKHFNSNSGKRINENDLVLKNQATIESYGLMIGKLLDRVNCFHQALLDQDKINKSNKTMYIKLLKQIESLERSVTNDFETLRDSIYVPFSDSDPGDE